MLAGFVIARAGGTFIYPFKGPPAKGWGSLRHSWGMQQTRLRPERASGLGRRQTTTRKQADVPSAAAQQSQRAAVSARDAAVRATHWRRVYLFATRPPLG